MNNFDAIKEFWELHSDDVIGLVEVLKQDKSNYREVLMYLYAMDLKWDTRTERVNGILKSWFNYHSIAICLTQEGEISFGYLGDKCVTLEIDDMCEFLEDPVQEILRDSTNFLKSKFK